jgi:hypothetical protein
VGRLDHVEGHYFVGPREARRRGLAPALRGGGACWLMKSAIWTMGQRPGATRPDVSSIVTALGK